MRLLLLLLIAATTSFAADYDLPDIVNKIDRLFRSQTSFAELEMTVQTPNWERTMTMSAWSRGLEDTFIVIHTPVKDAGVATLRRNDEMWNYFPKVDREVKVPPSMMRGSWMGSDFTNDDLVKETSMLRDYTASWSKDPNDTSDPWLWIDLKPNAQVVTVWAKIELKVDRLSFIPSEQRYYDERGELIRVMYLSEIKDLGGKRIPTRLEMIPQGDKKSKTIIIYKSAIFDRDVQDEIFTLRNLKKRR